MSTGKENLKTIKIAEWFSYGWLWTVDKLAPILFGVILFFLGFLTEEAKDLLKRWNVILLVLFLLLIVLYFYVDSKLNKERHKLKEGMSENETLKKSLDESEEARFELRGKLIALNEFYVSDFLSQILHVTMGISDDVRVSLYAYNEGSFILAGRFTTHPEYRKHHREIFSSEQGCIGKAWNDGGSFFCDDLPDPALEEGKYYQKLKDEFNIDKKDSRLLRMKSRTYCVNSVSKNSIRIGVIVFESTRCNVFDQELLQMEADSRKDQLVRIVEETIDLSPFKEMKNEQPKNVN